MRTPDEIIRRWDRLSAAGASIAFTSGGPPTRHRASTWPVWAILTVALLAIALAVLREPAGPGAVSGTPTGQQSGSQGLATPSENITPTASPQQSLVPTVLPGRSHDDIDSAVATAGAFESARAAGDWAEGWAMLSSFSQSQIGSVEAFANVEGAYNARGGSTFKVGAPTWDPSFMDVAFLGDPGIDAQAHSDFSRAMVVFVNHPVMDSASEASRAYLIAPVDSATWLVWIVR